MMEKFKAVFLLLMLTQVTRQNVVAAPNDNSGSSNTPKNIPKNSQQIQVHTSDLAGLGTINTISALNVLEKTSVSGLPPTKENIQEIAERIVNKWKSEDKVVPVETLKKWKQLLDKPFQENSERTKSHMEKQTKTKTVTKPESVKGLSKLTGHGVTTERNNGNERIVENDTTSGVSVGSGTTNDIKSINFVEKTVTEEIQYYSINLNKGDSLVDNKIVHETELKNESNELKTSKMDAIIQEKDELRTTENKVGNLKGENAKILTETEKSLDSIQKKYEFDELITNEPIKEERQNSVNKENYESFLQPILRSIDYVYNKIITDEL